MRKPANWSLIFVIVIFCGVIIFSGYYAYNLHKDTLVLNNKEKSKGFLSDLYFISNPEELKTVQQDIVSGRLRGGIAVYLPFFKESDFTPEIGEVAKFFRESDYLPVFVYDYPASFDYKTAKILLGIEVGGCHPMVCAYRLKWGGRDRDDIRGCVADDIQEINKEGLRKLVKFGLTSMREFILEEKKKQ